MDTELMDLLATASVITAAQQTGLLRALQAGPRTAQAYAEELGLDRRATTLVLDALVGLDLASGQGDVYDASKRLKAFMRPLQDARAPMENLWSHTATFLRTGEPITR